MRFLFSDQNKSAHMHSFGGSPIRFVSSGLGGCRAIRFQGLSCVKFKRECKPNPLHHQTRSVGFIKSVLALKACLIELKSNHDFLLDWIWLCFEHTDICPCSLPLMLNLSQHYHETVERRINYSELRFLSYILTQNTENLFSDLNNLLN